MKTFKFAYQKTSGLIYSICSWEFSRGNASQDHKNSEKCDSLNYFFIYQNISPDINTYRYHNQFFLKEIPSYNFTSDICFENVWKLGHSSKTEKKQIKTIEVTN